MFNLVVFENKDLAILDTLMTRFGPASMSTPKSTTPCDTLTDAMSAAESAFDKLKWDDWRLDKWIFRHGTDVPQCPYGSRLTLEEHQVRCDHLAQHMRWSVVPWYRGFEDVNLLITTDRTLAEDIASRASTRAPSQPSTTSAYGHSRVRYPQQSSTTKSWRGS